MVTLTYSQFLNENFPDAWMAIMNVPVHGRLASQLHKAARILQTTSDKVRKGFKELNESFPEPKDGGIPTPEQMKSMQDQMDKYVNTRVELDIPSVGDDIVSRADNITPRYLYILGELYAGNEKLPPLDNVTAIGSATASSS